MTQRLDIRTTTLAVFALLAVAPACGSANRCQTAQNAMEAHAEDCGLPVAEGAEVCDCNDAAAAYYDCVTPCYVNASCDALTGEDSAAAAAYAECLSRCSDPGVATCPAPAPDGLAVTVSPARMRARHSVGGTSCPQRLGTIIVYNPTDTDISVTAASNPVGGATLIDVDPPSGTVPAHGYLTLTVSFNCGRPMSFETDIVITPSTGPNITVHATMDISGG